MYGRGVAAVVGDWLSATRLDFATTRTHVVAFDFYFIVMAA